MGDLRALTSGFGAGWLVAGTHPNLRGAEGRLSEGARELAMVAHVKVNGEEEVMVCHAATKPGALGEFMEAEEMGVPPRKRCSRCRACAGCSEEGVVRSRVEEEELELLRQNIRIDTSKKRLKVRYPFVKDPARLVYNRGVAEAMAEKLEARLRRKGKLEEYHAEFQKFVDRGAVREISQEELAAYHGPKQFISHHPVWNEDSTSTPLRIVANSSLANNGTSLNDCLPKGPNSLNDAFEILVRFREYEVGLVGDISKAYQQMETGDPEMFLRLVMWKSDLSGPWKVYGFVTVTYGDRPAAALMEIAKELCAEAGEGVCLGTTAKIKKDSYVDDLVTGGTKKEVSTMVGKEASPGEFDGTVGVILGLGGFKIKAFAWSGMEGTEAIGKLGGKVLGYLWEPLDDLLGITWEELSLPAARGKGSIPLTLAKWEETSSVRITRRAVLSLTNSIYDPLGLACPFTIQLKLALKDIWEHEMEAGWDGELSLEMCDWWLKMARQALEAGELKFPRCARPVDALGRPEVVTFWDGSAQAYAATVFLRYEIMGGYETRLLVAKARVLPSSKKTSIPRSELNGLVLASRLSWSVTRSLTQVPSRVSLLGDSKSVILCLNKTSTALHPYFNSRVSEIEFNLSKIKEILGDQGRLDPVTHIPGTENAADLATRREGKITNLGPDSEWQVGPPFLRRPRGDWPGTTTIDEEEGEIIADEFRSRVGVIARAMQVKETVACQTRLGRSVEQVTRYSNSYGKVKRIMARVMRLWGVNGNGNGNGNGNVDKVELMRKGPNQEELKQAEILIKLQAMPETLQAMRQKRTHNLKLDRKGGLVVTTGRLGEKGMQKILGVDSLVVLDGRSRLAELIMMESHGGEGGMEHRGVAASVAVSRAKAWILGARYLAKKVVSRCPKCRLSRRKLQQQQMGDLPEKTLGPGPPFSHVALDFAGPFSVKGEVQARVTRKAWVVLYGCLATRAIVLLLTNGYSTDSFLMRHEEFVARYGQPQVVRSDRGTQLVRAGQVEAEMVDGPGSWNWARITAQNQASKWEFVGVGCQWRNGFPERMIGKTKACLKQAIPSGKLLSYGEMVMMLAKISSAINCRPLGVRGGSDLDEELQPICPNQLLIGRANCEQGGEYDGSSCLIKRVAYVSELVRAWWDSWYKQVLPHLIPLPKWRKGESNLQVGDIVQLYTPGMKVGRYKLARVTKTYEDARGLVRTVDLTFRRKTAREPRTECRPALVVEKMGVQRLCLVWTEREMEEAMVPDRKMGGDKEDDLHACKTTNNYLYSVVEDGSPSCPEGRTAPSCEADQMYSSEATQSPVYHRLDTLDHKSGGGGGLPPNLPDDPSQHHAQQ